MVLVAPQVPERKHLLRINATLDTLRDTIGTAIQVNLAVNSPPLHQPGG